MSTASLQTNQAEIFARSLDSREPFPADVARFLLQLELATSDRSRLDELAQKARQGTLSPAEDEELDEYRRVGRLVELMKLKAQLALQSS